MWMLIRFELRKIVSNRAGMVACALVLAMLVAVAALNVMTLGVRDYESGDYVHAFQAQRAIRARAERHAGTLTDERVAADAAAYDRAIELWEAQPELADVGGWEASGDAAITLAGATALALGIAIQNFPEGAIISLPLRAEGASTTRACAGGVASGLVEPVGSLVTIIFARQLVPWMPYLLSFAAGAMMYVVVEELVPQMTEGEHSHFPVLLFSLGFTVMMALDVALG